MGGRSADTAGSDFTHPFEYDPVANTWTTKAATYADNQVNNMACAVLTDAGTPYIYCVGGSAATQATATDRVFRYNPVTDVISPVASPWPGAMGTILPGGFSVFNNKLYILGGFNNPVGMVDTIYEFTPNPAGWVLKNAHLPAARGYIPTTTIGNFIYTGGGSMFDPTLILVDSTDSFRYDPVADSIITIASIPRATAETRALNVNGQMWVMGGGRTAPNPSNEVDIYNPGTNTWSLGTPFVTARRNFPTDTDGTCRIWLAGGYAPAAPTDSMEIFCCGGAPSPTPTATATPTASPSCTPSSFHVLIAYADIGGPPATLQSQILAEPGVTAVDLFDAFSGTPTLAQLTPYNIVVAFSNNSYADPVGMGNVLADYADTGGIVVGLNFDWFGAPFGLDGRWITGGYTPFNVGPTNFSTSCLGTYDTTHPLMQGISAGSLCAFFRHTLTLSSGAVSVAMYQDSQQLCAYKTNNGHTGVGINAYLGANPENFSGPFGHVIVNAGRWLISGPCGSPTPTPTASPSATATPTGSPSCTPSAWQNRANMPTDLYGAAGASNGTFFYAAGGYSFSSGLTLDVVNRFDPVANSWTAMAPMPQAAIMATAVYYPPTNKIYVFGGEDAVSGTNYNITRIYDIATNTWTTGANMPDVHSFAAGGYIGATGKIYIISGYNTGQVTSAQPNTWAYDPVANSWMDLTATIPFPHPTGGAAFGVINNKLYIAGGRDAANLVINLTWEFDPVAGTYTAKADEPGSFQNNVPGSAAAQGLLWVFGGGNPFAGPRATNTGSGSMTPPFVADKAAFAWPIAKGVKGPLQPATSNGGRNYNPATNSWTTSPNMNTVRSFTSGGAIGTACLSLPAGITARPRLPAQKPKVFAVVERLHQRRRRRQHSRRRRLRRQLRH